MNKLELSIFIDLLNIVDEDTCISMLNSPPHMIKYIKNPSEAVQLAAVTENGNSIGFLKNPSEAVQVAAMNENIYAIQYIKNPKEFLQLLAVNHDGFCIQYIKNPSEQIQLEAVKQDGKSIRYIKQPSEQVQLESVKKASEFAIYEFESFMRNCNKKINSSKALNLLYKKAPEQFKEKIKSHKHYKSDAELVLESIK